MDRHRQKLLEAMIFFAESVKYPSKMMMYKLLAELDFRHFKATGLPVTNLQYEAWKRGPVPKELHKEISPQKDEIVLPNDFGEGLWVEKVDCDTHDGSKKTMFLFHPRRKPHLNVFSPRQQEILKQVADIYKTATPTEASKASHEPGTPWTITVQKCGDKEGAIIDFLDFLDKKSPVTRDEAREMIEEMRAFQRNYSA